MINSCVKSSTDNTSYLVYYTFIISFPSRIIQDYMTHIDHENKTNVYQCEVFERLLLLRLFFETWREVLPYCSVLGSLPY